MSNDSPPIRAITALVLFFALFVVGGLVFYGLTPDEHKTDIWDALRLGLPSLFAAVPAVLGWLYARSAAHRLNGSFDNRIRRLVNEVLDERGGVRDTD